MELLKDFSPEGQDYSCRRASGGGHKGGDIDGCAVAVRDPENSAGDGPITMTSVTTAMLSPQSAFVF